jgi:hypothetical protein
MKPFLPVQIPQGAALHTVFPLELECAMLRGGVRCNNLAHEAVIFPSEVGYTVIPFCSECFEQCDDDWVPAMHRVADRGLFEYK